MSKRSNIKWRDKDNKEIARIVKNYNAKIDRVSKKNPYVADLLPTKTTVKELKSKITTRNDFARELNSLKRFSKKGAEQIEVTPSGMSLTKYEIKETKIKTRIVNTKRTKERNRLNLSQETGTMGQVEKQNLKPKKFSLDKTPKEWEKFVESLEREIKTNFNDELLKEYKANYLSALIDNLGAEGSELAKLLIDVDAKTIFENSVSNPILNIDFIYDPLDMDIITGAKLEAWNEVLK